MSRPQAGPSLVRAVGTWQLAASIFNITVGAGIFRLPAVAAGMLGAAAPLAYLVCALAMGLIVCCIAEAGSRVERSGGPYAYVETVFGPFAGYLTGVLVWLTGTVALAAVSGILAGNLAAAVPTLGTGGGRAAFLIVLFGGLALVNVRGVRQGTWVIAAASVAKLLPLLVLVVVALPHVRAENLAATAAPGLGSLARAAITLVFAFAGIESALVPGGEVHAPARTVPRAIAIAMVGVTVLYLLLQLVAQGVLGPALAQTRDVPLAATARAAAGAWAYTLLIAGATISMFGYVTGMTLAIPRALFAFAEDGFLPAAVARVHPRFRTPWIAILVESAIVCGVAVTSTFEQLAVIASLATLLLYLGCILAAWKLRRRDVRSGEGRPIRLPLGPTIHILGSALIAFLLTSITRREWLLVGLVLAVSSAVYVFTRTLTHRAPGPAAERGDG